MTNTVDTRTLISLLDDPDRTTRQHAAIALGTVREQAAADALVSRLGTEGDCFVREALTWASVQNSELTTPGVLDALGSDEASTRMQAAHVLSKMGNPEHASAIIPLVADDDPQVAVKAFRAAANTGDPVVIPVLIARLGTGDAEQRDALGRAFGTLGAPAVPALVEALGGTPDVAINSLDALAQIASPEADGAVGAMAGLLTSEDAEVRLSAVSALGEFDREVTSDALAAASGSDDPRLSAVAKRLLG